MKMHNLDLSKRKMYRKLHANVRRNIIDSAYSRSLEDTHDHLLSSTMSSAGKSSEAANQQKKAGDQ